MRTGTKKKAKAAEVTEWLHGSQLDRQQRARCTKQQPFAVVNQKWRWGRAKRREDKFSKSLI